MISRYCLICIYSFLLSNGITGQSILIEPYLQNASSSSVYIKWETDFGNESTVEWGLDENLENSTQGISYTSGSNALVHEVHITGLTRLTHYYYRVKTDTSYSAIYKFKTPPFTSDGQNVRIVAMSDMQRDNSHPRKFEEIVNEGVINYINDISQEELTNALDAVLIPGDLVVNGNNISQWRNDFFGQGKNLFAQIPFYPVLGNHENNAQLYFTYMKLPENGSAGYEEHWWSKNFGNIRVIGLNSNGPFNNQDQLDWLEELLDISCSADSIDFVIAQLHHPHKSELWTPGESNFTGEVITLLENFTTSCNKPSIHLFGHTHGYSRGQSRDHKHLWINVASAGGAIDNWGEFPNFDYDEFSVSQDEYGFVIIEGTNDEAPRLDITRISRGDQDSIKNNIITDVIRIEASSKSIMPPTPISPSNETLPPECIILEADSFTAEEGEHGQSHWQITYEDSDFSAPVFESWNNFENWYFDINTQAADDLTDEVASNLEENTAYKWRVRYRDKEFNWSPWSEASSFRTDFSLSLPNQIRNPGAEEGLMHWNILEGVVEALPKDTCSGISPYSGEQYFIVGGLCDHSIVARMNQEIDLAEYIDSIDTGNYPVHFGGYLSNFGGLDLPEMKIIFLDSENDIIEESNVLSTLNNRWTLLEETMLIPVGARSIQVELKGTRNGGTDNDSYFDDLFLKLGSEKIDCSGLTSSVNIIPPSTSGVVIPNPNLGRFRIEMPFEFSDNMDVFMMNTNGQKVNIQFTPEGKNLEIESSGLPSGQYYFWITQGNNIRLQNKILITN